MNPAIEEPLEAHDKLDDVGLLMELLGDDTVIAPKEKPATKRNSVAIADMTDVEFRAYKAQKQSKRRASLKAREAKGSIKFNAASTRDALADAALMILAHGLPGTDTIQKYLERVFADQVGAPLTITARARAGDLKPKLIRFAVK